MIAVKTCKVMDTRVLLLDTDGFVLLFKSMALCRPAADRVDAKGEGHIISRYSYQS
jgi:hypothetical protein